MSRGELIARLSVALLLLSATVVLLYLGWNWQAAIVAAFLGRYDTLLQQDLDRDSPWRSDQ